MLLFIPRALRRCNLRKLPELPLVGFPAYLSKSRNSSSSSNRRQESLKSPNIDGPSCCPARPTPWEGGRSREGQGCVFIMERMVMTWVTQIFSRYFIHWDYLPFFPNCNYLLVTFSPSSPPPPSSTHQPHPWTLRAWFELTKCCICNAQNS